jgi:hypothetical protein
VRAINHALTGAVIGMTVPNPAVAMGAALLSHFVCDVIPHYGEGPASIKTRKFRNLLIIDALLCVLLVFVIGLYSGSSWFIVAMCAFLAAAPDFASVNRYIHVVHGIQWAPGWFTKFASGIQWFERPVGIIVEAVWCIVGISLLYVLLPVR